MNAENVMRKTGIETKPKRLTAHEKNQRAFARIHKRYARTHAGQWIGLVNGKVAAIAPTIERLHEEMVRIEPRISRRMVFQAGAPWTQARKLVILLFV